jgi:hypothetical protein
VGDDAGTQITTSTRPRTSRRAGMQNSPFELILMFLFGGTRITVLPNEK